MRWFTADTHFGHAKVIPYCQRPWSSVPEMNEGLIQNWNAVVKSTDEVFILGDFSFLNTALTIELIRRLNGKLTLVKGNHDNVRSMEKAARLGFTNWFPIASQITLNGELFELSHFPYTGDTMVPERFLDKRVKDQGRRILHGHIHKLWKVNGRMINVGVDVWNYRPVSEEEILAIL
jgi:calcineurin-like phosphoesterase family protein